MQLESIPFQSGQGQRRPAIATHPLVIELAGIMDGVAGERHKATMSAGLSRQTVRSWMISDARAGIDAFESVVNAIGFQLVAVKTGDPHPSIRTTGRGLWSSRREDDVHWTVACARKAIRDNGLSLAGSLRAAGIGDQCAKAWWRTSPKTNVPSLPAITRWLGVLGYELRIEEA